MGVVTPEGAAQRTLQPMVSASRDAREDFLFHLYRGSELLDDDRPLEAKSELEHALTLEPSDAPGRSLLAVVCFRLGLYSRAIGLYEALLVEQPGDAALRLNLALCELKAGKAEAALVELQRLVDENGDHARAWGYLGLALERLGRIDDAHHAFERAGQDEMARLMVRRGAKRAHTFELETPLEPAGPTVSGTPTFEELDSGKLDLAIVAPGPSTAPRRRLDTLGWGLTPPAETTTRATWVDPPTLADFVASARAPATPSGNVRLLGSTLARVELEASGVGFALRLDALRTYAGTLDPELLLQQRRAGAETEAFGGIGTPFVLMKGPGHALIGPRASHRIAAMELENDVLFVRREALLGFERCLNYENGRLPLGDGDGAALVQLHGDGAVMLELVGEAIATDVRGGAHVTVRKEIVVGWVGRLLPRTLPVGEAPCGQRGLIDFSGEGTLLLAAK